MYPNPIPYDQYELYKNVAPLASPYLPQAGNQATRYPAETSLDTLTELPALENFLEDDTLPRRPQVSDDPLESLLENKQVILLKSIQDVVGLLYERERIKYDHLKLIDLESCETKTRVFDLERWPVGSSPPVDGLRANREQKLTTFEREKRTEEVACWRDVLRLKSELRDFVKELWRERQRQGLFSAEV